MGLFDDVGRFFETRLDEFLRNHPELEIQALEEQLKEQEEDTLRLILQLQKQEKQKEEEILATAQEIQRWHERVQKAKQADRLDLAQAAKEREAALLRQGNQLWGQMQGTKERIEQAKKLYKQIQQRRKELKLKADAVKASKAAQTSASKAEKNWGTQGWQSSSTFAGRASAADPVEQQFQQWETESELEQMKRSMGKK